MPAERRALARTVRELRAREGLTQEQLADASGVSRAMVTELESGRRGATFERVVCLARGLDIPLDDFARTFMARLDEGR